MDQRQTPPSAREEKQVRALHRRKKRLEEGRFLAEGVRVVEDLLESSLETEWVLAASALGDTPRGSALLSRVADRDLPLRWVSDEGFARLAATEQPQGVLAIARIPQRSLDTMAAAIGDAVVVLFDGVQDPGNLGTLSRTAEALGAVGLVALPGTVDPWNPKSVRAAAGSLFRVPILTSEWDDAARRLRAGGYRLLAADSAGAPPTGADRRVGLVMGNEGAGISKEVMAAVDGTIGIPLKGRAESLNVAAAAAILLYELTR